MSIELAAIEGFKGRFGREPDLIVTSPGRVNLIGEHTDYNDGFVLPMAIDRTTVIAAGARGDRRVKLVSEGFGTGGFDLDDLERGGETWIEYVKGVAWAVGAGASRGFDGFIAGDIPLGASLSSSASLEVGMARLFSALTGDDWDPVEAARLSQRAENDWVGINSGIMDQLVCAAGRAGHALLIDCRTLDMTPVAIPAGVSVVILDTGTRRRLTESRYNERRRQCEAAARASGVPSLRDLSQEALDSTVFHDPVLAKRARHVVGENRRTLAAVDALRTGDAEGMGELMAASHRSLRDDFEVSGHELDSIVEAAGSAAGCLGARMTGGGFAGCAVALVATESVEAFSGEVAQRYLSIVGRHASIYVCNAADGVSVAEYLR